MGFRRWSRSKGWAMVMDAERTLRRFNASLPAEQRCTCSINQGSAWTTSSRECVRHGDEVLARVPGVVLTRKRRS